MKRKLISYVLVLAMILSMVSPVAAVGQEKETYIQEAEQLQLLGVFQGTGNGFELNREPTRLEGLVMLIRLLGKEAEAKAMSNQTSIFTDVPAWGVGYANYAYENGLTKGIGNNLFGSIDKMNVQSYVTFMLRALEYDDSKGDFSYNLAPKFAGEKDILLSTDVLELLSKPFLRDHVAKVSMLSLMANTKGKSTNLLDKLVAEGAILKSVADQIRKMYEARFEVHFIDVGQADSILIKKGNESMLIDAGNYADSNLVLNYLKEQKIERLNYVIATHPHEDHIGGLDIVIDTFEVEKVIMSDAISTTKIFEDLLDSISNKGLSITKAKVGDIYSLNGASFTILAPIQDKYSDLNNFSVVVKLTNDANTFLFTGDAEGISESEMLIKNKEILKADVIKLGHHGSSTSTTQDFLDAVNPTYAVIAVGSGNTYGLPNLETLNRLFAKNIQTYRTDLQGTIIAKSDGKTISFNTLPTINDEPITVTPTPVVPPTPATSKDIIISNVDKAGELVTIKNNSEQAIDLMGWKLLSVTGNQEFIFPEYILKANSIVTVASGDVEGDLIWGRGNIWNNSSSDPAILYDAQGNQVFRYED